MSTYWGYHCETCDVYSPCWYYGWEQMALLLNAREDILRLQETHPLLHILEIGTPACQGDPSPISFFWDHVGHPLTVYNEYGQTLDEWKGPRPLTRPSPAPATAPLLIDILSRGSTSPLKEQA